MRERKHRRPKYRRAFLPKKLGTSTELVVVKKNLAKGLQDLVESARRDSEQACWIYAHEQERWYSVTPAPSYHEDGEVSCVGGLWRDCNLYRFGPYVSVFHTHPKALLEELVAKNMELVQEISPTPDEEALKFARWRFRELACAQNLLPSRADIHSFVRTEGQYFGSVHLDFWVVSQTGATEVRVCTDSSAKKVAEHYSGQCDKLFLAARQNEAQDHLWLQARYCLARQFCHKLNEAKLGLHFRSFLDA